MHSATLIFIVLGSILLLGLATDYLGRKSRLPRVTLLFLFGFLLGPGGVALIPEKALEWFPLIADTALLLVGFLLGGKITLTELARNGKIEMMIEVELPGVELEDIELLQDGSTLVVKGNKQSHRTEHDKEYKVVERSCGRYKRIIPLGFEPEDNGIHAKFRNGVLTVTVAKSISTCHA